MYPDLGMRKPGSTVFVPFHTFDSNDPSASVTITGLAVTDIEVYKDAGMTQRGSDAGYALVDTDGIDLDGITGIHGFTIDTSDNTTAGFWEVGSEYTVVVSSITVDAATVNFIAAKFTLGYQDAILNTTIATLASQTSFTLEEGPADDDALNGCSVLVHDLASDVQIAIGYVTDYTGATRTVTLAADPGIFTMAAGDNASFFMPANVAAVAGTAQTANDNGADINTLLDRVGAFTGTGVNNILGFLQAIMRSDVTTPSDVGGTYDDANDSLEAIRNRGDAAWTTGSGSGLTPLASGTAQGGTASTVQLAAGETFANDELNGNVVKITSGTGAGQARVITDYVGATDTATVYPNWTTNPDNTSVYEVVEGSVNAAVWNMTGISTALETSGDIADAVLDEALADHTAAGSLGERVGRIPNAAAGGNGGLGTVDANNRIAGIQGTINDLDGLDTAQDTQHSTTQGDLTTLLGRLTAARAGYLDELAAANIPADIDTLLSRLSAARAGYLDELAAANIPADIDTLLSRVTSAVATAAALATLDAIVDNLNLGIIYGAAQTGTLSTTQMTSDLTGYADDQLIGRIITFTSGNAEGEQTDITDYANASGLLTFTALTTAPANGDTFKIT